MNLIGTNETVIVRTVNDSGAVDRWGNPTTTATETEYKALVAWGPTGFDRTPEWVRSASSGTVVFYGQDIPLDENDTLLVQGKEFRITSLVQKWTAPAGWMMPGGTVVEIEKVVL